MMIDYIDPGCWWRPAPPTTIDDVKFMLAMSGFTFEVIEETWNPTKT